MEILEANAGPYPTSVVQCCGRHSLQHRTEDTLFSVDTDAFDVG